MSQDPYDVDTTALLLIDPYNDFLSEGGKLWPRIKVVAEANQCVQHMLDVLQAARKARQRVFYALHRRYRPGDYERWKFVAPVQKAAWASKTFDMERGAAWSVRSSSRSQATSSHPSTGARAVSPTPISTCCSNGMASSASSSSG
jgi:hypothetical protein